MTFLQVSITLFFRSYIIINSFRFDVKSDNTEVSGNSRLSCVSVIVIAEAPCNNI